MLASDCHQHHKNYTSNDLKKKIQSSKRGLRSNSQKWNIKIGLDFEILI